MNKKFLLLPLLLIAMTAGAESIVLVASTNGSDSVFAIDQVRKLVLTSASVDIVNNEGSVLLSVPKADIARVEFTDGTPTAVEATIVQDNDAVKIIEHGQVYILRCGKKYTIMGVEVEQK